MADTEVAAGVSSISVDDITLSKKDETASPAQDFSYVPLEEGKQKKKKVPRRVLHFSDGIMEEYSTDEEEDETDLQPVVDPKTLKWPGWFMYHIKNTATRALGAADFCGEKLAWFFGITSPKYQFYIDEYNRMKEEEEAERRQEALADEMEARYKAEKLAAMESAASEGDRAGGDPSELKMGAPPSYESLEEVAQNPKLSDQFAAEMKY